MPLDKKERGCHCDKEMYVGLGPFHQERCGAVRGWGRDHGQRKAKIGLWLAPKAWEPTRWHVLN